MYEKPFISHDDTVSVSENVRILIDNLDRFRFQIEAALTYTGGTHSFDDVCRMVLSGRVMFWAGVNSFIIMEINEFPRQKHLHIWLGGGDIEELALLHPRVHETAKQFGCTHVTINGRPGWGKALKKFGAKPSYTALSHEVNYG